MKGSFGGLSGRQLLVFSILVVAITIGLGAALSHSGSLAPAHLAAVPQAAHHGPDQCRTGYVYEGDEDAGSSDDDADKKSSSFDPTASGADIPFHGCVRADHPESFDDLLTANTEVAARDTAPFVDSAVGAYASALRTQATVDRLPRASYAGQAWTQAGNSPECGAQTSNSTACPAPSAANGQYSEVGSLGFRTLSSRVSSIAYNPNNTKQIFISPTAGGVWESDDSGQTFHSIGDGLPTQVIGAIAYDAPLNRIIAASGDNSFGGDGIPGHGIYYSDNDGSTWLPATGIPDLILSFKVVVSPVDTSGKTIYAATSEGLFKSTDGGASYVNVDLPTSPSGYSPNCAGVTASSPGGQTSSLCFFANDVTDVVVKGTTTANGPAGAVIAAVGWRAGQRGDTNASGNPLDSCSQGGTATQCLQAPQNGLYTSTTGNPGSFTYITPTGSTAGTGLPSTPIFGRTALAIASGAGENSDAVYALVQDAVKFQGCTDTLDVVPPASTCNSTVSGEAQATVLNGMFVSYDFGKTWTKIMDSTQLKDPQTNSSLLGNPGYGPGIQSWYNLWIAADPVDHDAKGDPTRVIFGLEEIWENNQVLNTVASGGSTGSVLATPYTAFPGGTAATDPWVVVGRYWNACGAVNTPVPCNGNPTTGSVTSPGSTTHPDQHAAAIIPDGSGGFTLFAGSDGGIYSQHVASGGDLSNDNWGDGLNATVSALQPYDAEMSDDGTIVSGLQDNGEMKTSPNGAESEIYGGDAFFTAIDPKNSNNIIEEYTYGSPSLSTDGGDTWTSIAPGSDPTGDTGTNPCGSSTTLFATPIEQDPTMDGHMLLGCTQIQEALNGFTSPCGDPTCATTTSPFSTVYDLSTLPSPNGATNIPSALALRGADAYVGYCGYCDPATEKVPFGNGIATNVDGPVAPKIGTSNGWHAADAYCANCQTANGRLPERYITSIQEDPKDPQIVYVTEGGYGRRWIPPGSFGEDTSNVGVGHLFVSRDGGEHFTNISGNLPDVSANWTTFYDDHLVIATDLGVYIDSGATGATCSPTYNQLGTGLPNVPVFTVRTDPANGDKLLIATYGRGDYFYNFGGDDTTLRDTQPAIACVSSSPTPTTTTKSTTKTPPKPTAATCPTARGSISSHAVGPVTLDRTRRQLRAALRKYKQLGQSIDYFCLKGGPGIRVLYANPRLLKQLPKRDRKKYTSAGVLALTGNHYYTFHRVRAGLTIVRAKKLLGGHVNGPFRQGPNLWYGQRDGSVVLMLKTLHGKIQEIGIADPAIAKTSRQQAALLRDFRF